MSPEREAVQTSLDAPSRATVGRFALKLVFSVLLALWSTGGVLLAISTWLALYAVITALVALLGGARFDRTSFTHWDEVLWLLAAAQAFGFAVQAAGVGGGA